MNMYDVPSVELQQGRVVVADDKGEAPTIRAELDVRDGAKREDLPQRQRHPRAAETASCCSRRKRVRVVTLTHHTRERI
jgi:hypothetical protein